MPSFQGQQLPHWHRYSDERERRGWGSGVEWAEPRLSSVNGWLKCNLLAVTVTVRGLPEIGTKENGLGADEWISDGPGGETCGTSTLKRQARPQKRQQGLTDDGVGWAERPESGAATRRELELQLWQPTRRTGVCAAISFPFWDARRPLSSLDSSSRLQHMVLASNWCAKGPVSACSFNIPLLLQMVSLRLPRSARSIFFPKLTNLALQSSARCDPAQ